MYFPLITKRSGTYDRQLYRRKGKSGGSGGKSGGGTSPVKSSTPIISDTGGTPRNAISYGAGGGPASVIPSGHLFAGRLAGGATRSQTYGNRLVFLLKFILVHLTDKRSGQ